MNHRGLPSFPRVPADRSHWTRTRVPVSVRSRKTTVLPLHQAQSPVPERHDNPVPVSDSQWIKNRTWSRGAGVCRDFDLGVGKFFHETRVATRGGEFKKEKQPDSQWVLGTTQSSEVHQFPCRGRERCGHFPRERRSHGCVKSAVSKSSRCVALVVRRGSNEIDNGFTNRLGFVCLDVPAVPSEISLLGRREVAGGPHAHDARVCAPWIQVHAPGSWDPEGRQLTLGRSRRARPE